jgi:diguanylate cyclase (GGDEF)-like protein
MARTTGPSLAVASAPEVSPNGSPGRALRARLNRIELMREQVAKAWLVEIVLGSPLAEAESLPMGWAATELPELVTDVLRAVGDAPEPVRLSDEALARAAKLAELRNGALPSQLAREVAALHSALLASFRDELSDDAEHLGEAAERLATAFGLVTGAALDVLGGREETVQDPLTGLLRTAQMRRRLDQLIESARRYGQPFSLVLLDIEGPGAREEGGESGHEAALAIVAASVKESIRVVDEAFRLDDDELCVLAPSQTTEQGVKMAERLSAMLAALERAGGLRITISAGVVSCPENGDDPERLLRQADTAMWRARATGQPVTVGGLQDR